MGLFSERMSGLLVVNASGGNRFSFSSELKISAAVVVLWRLTSSGQFLSVPHRASGQARTLARKQMVCLRMPPARLSGPRKVRRLLYSRQLKRLRHPWTGPRMGEHCAHRRWLLLGCAGRRRGKPPTLQRQLRARALR